MEKIATKQIGADVERIFSNQSISFIRSIVHNVVNPDITFNQRICSLELYTYMLEQIAEYVNTRTVPRILSTTGSSMFVTFANAWEAHKTLVTCVWYMFVGLDGTRTDPHLRPPGDYRTVTAAALDAFFGTVFGRIKPQLVLVTLEAIDNDRRGNKVDTGALRQCTEVMR